MDYRAKADKAFADAQPKDRIAWDLSEFLAVNVPEPADGDTWGNWRFEQRTLTLQYRNADGYTDEIDLERMTSNLELIIWMKDFTGKVFMTPEDIGNFFLAIQDLTKVWWMPNTNVTEIIRKKYGKQAA
jgi:hypothetical protein